jgi:hypothetical protein
MNDVLHDRLILDSQGLVEGVDKTFLVHAAAPFGLMFLPLKEVFPIADRLNRAGRFPIGPVSARTCRRGRSVYEVHVQFAKQYGWKAVTVGLGALTGLPTQRLLEVIWKALRGSTAPKLPADRRSSWVDALRWAVATGVGTGVARLLAIRSAAAV